MSFIRKAKKKLRELDDKHDEVVAGFHKTLRGDYLDDDRQDRREILKEIRYEEKSEEDDGALIHWNPMRDWQKKKAEKFLELTSTPEVLHKERITAARRAAAAARAASRSRELVERTESDKANILRNLKKKKRNW